MRYSTSHVTALLLAGTIVGFALPSWAGAAQLCDNQRTRALALSGGGFRGAFEVGATYHLVVHRGCDFQDFAGVSTGALSAAFLAQARSTPNPGSWKHLADKATELVRLWKQIHNSNQLSAPRLFGLYPGLAAVAILNWESVYRLDPLRSLVDKYIKLDELKASGRSVRVGVVSFFDSTYREILFTTERRNFLEYVVASTAIPVFADMPRIKEDPVRSAEQFADGGARHTTPIGGYFQVDESHVPLPGSFQFDANHVPDPHFLRYSKAPPVIVKREDPEKHPLHTPPLDEAFVVVAFPYKSTDDDGVESSTGRDKLIRGGRKILARTHDLYGIQPELWDLIFAQLANAALQWRDKVYKRVKDLLHDDAAFNRFVCDVNPTFPIESFNRRAEPGFVCDVNPTFPIESFNRRAEPGWSLPYAMRFFYPENPLPDPIEGGLSKIIPKLLMTGCLRANELLKNEFGDLASRCKTDPEL